MPAGAGSVAPKPLLITSCAEEAEAAAKMVASRYDVVGLEGGSLPDLRAARKRECLLWLNGEEPKTTSIIGLLYMAGARSVSEIPPGPTAAAAAAAGGDLTSFESFVSASKITHPKFTPQILETSSDNEELIPPTEDEKAAWDQLGLRLTTNGAAVPNLENVVRILEGMPHFHGRIWLDEFVGDVFTNLGVKEMGGKRQWTDADSLALQLSLQRNLGIARIGLECVHSGVMAFAHANKRNPPKEWLIGLQNKWDGKKRIGGFFRDYMGADDSEYTTAVSRNFFLALVARVFQPGCKVDNMVVLEGSQGRKKSTALKRLGGEWFTECNEPLGAGSNKDFYSILRGKMIVEIAELDSFSKADTARIKAIITTATDRYRAPYAKVAQEVPRTSVFVGTTNEDEYLADPTGGRRFWPVKTGHIDDEKIAEDREQLFAESVCAYRDRPVWWELPQEEARALQDARRRGDVWEEEIEEWLSKPTQSMKQLTSLMVAKEALGMDVERINHAAMIRIANCMKALGYSNKSPIKLGEKSVKVWRKIK